MPSGKIMVSLAQAGPWFVKQLPKLWPLLLDAKNREWLVGVAANLASQSPAKRLRAKVELTAALADNMAAQGESESERARAQEWSRQARNLTLRLDMPVVGRKAKDAHRRSVRQQLEILQAEMDRHLGS